MVIEDRRVSIEKLKEMLNSEGENYIDEEVEKIRDFLYVLVHIEMEYIKTKLNEMSEKGIKPNSKDS